MSAFLEVRFGRTFKWSRVLTGRLKIELTNHVGHIENSGSNSKIVFRGLYSTFEYSAHACSFCHIRQFVCYEDLKCSR